MMGVYFLFQSMEAVLAAEVSQPVELVLPPQQYPLKMASLAVEAINEFVKNWNLNRRRRAISISPTPAFTLVTDKPVPGVPSITSKEGLQLCLG